LKYTGKNTGDLIKRAAMGRAALKLLDSVS
jgi:hypothetical protein